MFIIVDWLFIVTAAELAQSVERTTLNRVVVGSIPTFGVMMVMVASKVNKEYGSRNVN